ncbi:hypothetical protein AAFF_G00061080 [Aldrovandia affinis]|uniref:Uncharacterized protein n=1 Tax=Aldrovandia affinis TaxID=143900 RepID=A0AAD7WDQ8_9TELE|nr:hypothetical protein AAFF_G00061080 [Aldrovandia affinis]
MPSSGGTSCQLQSEQSLPIFQCRLDTHLSNYGSFCEWTVPWLDLRQDISASIKVMKLRGHRPRGHRTPRTLPPGRTSEPAGPCVVSAMGPQRSCSGLGLSISLSHFPERSGPCPQPSSDFLHLSTVS